ncbi:MAG: alpha/beta hydrolase, partial [Anaerolineae bacterium]|nr:alpha/beta hydrolase [Anaerolineae bacterium]
GPNRTPDQVDPLVRRRAMAIMIDLFKLPDDEGTPRPLDPPAAGRLAEIVVPTLVVVGDNDVEPIISLADVLTDQISGAKKVVMAGVAHYPNMERTAEFNQIILDFLASV